ncbi:2-dehydropantoate 2-reductase [Niallia sp. 01092]|uniref:2-dehydropantoate 2-reductase n=1 Tax=unclassified Niallia TaxID=2837522 RepID=UPI003FCF7CB2
MKIGIIGGGAIGLLCAYFLTKAHDVTVYVRSENQLQLLKQKGISYKRDKVTENIRVHAELFSNWTGTEDLTIVTVKQYQLESIYEKVKQNLKQLNGMLFLQNGMSHLNVLQTLSTNHFMVGIIEHGAVKINENTVQHLGVGAIKLSPLHSQLEPIVTELVQKSDAAFMIKKERDYLFMMKKKLVVNSIVNTLTSILQIKNGELAENPFYFRLMKDFMEEIAEILQLNSRENELYFSYVLEVIKQTSNNKSSMLKDLEEKRPTEVDSILGYLLEEAKNHHINALLTKTYYFMIKGKEKEQEGRGA